MPHILGKRQSTHDIPLTIILQLSLIISILVWSMPTIQRALCQLDFFKGSFNFYNHWMTPACNPSTWKAEAGGLLRVSDQSELHSQILSQNPAKLHSHFLFQRVEDSDLRVRSSINPLEMKELGIWKLTLRSSQDLSPRWMLEQALLCSAVRGAFLPVEFTSESQAPQLLQHYSILWVTVWCALQTLQSYVLKPTVLEYRNDKKLLYIARRWWCTPSTWEAEAGGSL